MSFHTRITFTGMADSLFPMQALFMSDKVKIVCQFQVQRRLKQAWSSG